MGIVCLPVSSLKTCRTIILTVVLYGRETWSPALRIFENSLLRRIFGPKRDGVLRGCRKLHNEELHKLYALLCIDRVIKSRSEMGGACNTYGRDEKCVRSFNRKI
jgi:hypothetical protein